MLMQFVLTAILSLFLIANAEVSQVDVEKSLIWGPGLKPDDVVLPARYFFIHAVDNLGKKFTESPPLAFVVEIKGNAPHGKCRHKTQLINRGDGSFIVRYTITDWCDQVELEIRYNGSHVAQSPYIVRDRVYSASCNCPQKFLPYMKNNNCAMNSEDKDVVWSLYSYQRVDFDAIRNDILNRFNTPDSVSLCHYVVKNQQIWRKCYGKYTGFKMFMDSTLLALARVTELPDMEFFLNLGDYPISMRDGRHSTREPYPIFSWCSSEEAYDIMLPTYDLTESSLENMGRVTLDTLSVQEAKFPWHAKTEKAFFRGRDSSRERLDLIELARKHPDLINASITNFFFFRDEEKKYGPKAPLVSFSEFFRHKYQLNMDGTVAAYRLPYLLAGNSVVFKQKSNYREFYFDKLAPHKHYIGFKRDLSDLVEKLQWMKSDDKMARQIVQSAREFVNKNLLPQHIFCYHMTLFSEWSKRLVSPVNILSGMERVRQKTNCSCIDEERDEL